MTGTHPKAFIFPPPQVEHHEYFYESLQARFEGESEVRVFASAEVVPGERENEHEIMIRNVELHWESHEVRYCTEVGTGRSVDIANAAKWSPKAIYLVPLEWCVAECPSHAKLPHVNWHECYTCWHNGDFQSANTGRKVRCSVCPRSFHANGPCESMTEIPLKDKRQAWQCFYCTFFASEANLLPNSPAETASMPVGTENSMMHSPLSYRTRVDLNAKRLPLEDSKATQTKKVAP